MTWKTLQLSDYDEAVDMLYKLLNKYNDSLWSADLEHDIGAIIDKLEESK